MVKSNIKSSFYFLNTQYLTALLFFLSVIPTYGQIKIERHANVQKLALIDTTRRIAVSTQHPPKIALIIGNAMYNERNKLNAPVNSANIISKKMTELGFEVTLLKNITKIEMRRAFISFGRKARHASMAFVYFSGHIVKLDGGNYMVPIDAILETKKRIKNETLSIDYLISQLSGGAKIRISIDSCYPNSYEVGSQDLKNELCFAPPSDLAKDIFISFSAFENELARTLSDDDTSLFSYVFNFNFQQKSAYESFLDTKKLVKKLSSGKQDVYFYGTLSENEYWGPYMQTLMSSVKMGYKKFIWPPPYTSAREKINGIFFKDSETLGDVNKKLLSSLDNQGYFETSHYAIEEGETRGFAIATRMEQINVDASTMENDRWNPSLISSTSDFSLSKYVKSLFFPREGFFRVIVFAVVNEPFHTSGNTTKDEVITWSGSGESDLADTINTMDFEGFNVHALIYEYRLTENNITAEIKKPSEHSGRLHLEKSGLWAQLANTE